MPIVDNATAAEQPWRPGYRRFVIAGPEQGVACSTSYSVIEPGAGAPTHRHETVDEVIVVVAGVLEVWFGPELPSAELQSAGRQRVEANHTVCVPAGTPHGFVAVGDKPACIYAFLPKAGTAVVTTYIDGPPPAGDDRR